MVHFFMWKDYIYILPANLCRVVDDRFLKGVILKLIRSGTPCGSAVLLRMCLGHAR